MLLGPWALGSGTGVGDAFGLLVPNARQHIVTSRETVKYRYQTNQTSWGAVHIGLLALFDLTNTSAGCHGVLENGIGELV
jgi:hypothetical protein